MPAKFHRVLIDMDGVLADFVSAVLKLYNRDASCIIPGNWHIHQWLGITESAMWERIGRASDFWAYRIEPYPWKFTLWRMAGEFGQRLIASSPSLNPNSASSKISWLQTHYGQNFNTYMLGSDKPALARPDSILIDDSETNCEAFAAAGGRAVLFPQPWNRDGYLTQEKGWDPVAYVKHMLELSP